MRWVHRNIGAFGGDRDDVTIAGQSAGGGSVCAHLASPTARGLFVRAVIQSGALCTLHPLREVETGGTTFAAANGCPDPATAAACLRAKPVAALLAGADPPPNGPLVGGPVLPVQPRSAIESGRWHRVPVLIGSNHDEMRVLALANGNPGTAAGYAQALTRLFGSAAPQVQAAYPVGARYPTPLVALGAVYSDFTLICGTYEMATVFASRTSTYLYEFDDPDAPPQFLIPGFSWGAYHTGEVPYLFTYATAVPLSGAQRRLSDQMMRYWTSFARSGRPSARGSIRWPRYDTRTTRVLSLRPTGNRVITDFATEHHCALWHALGV
jgi:para-nitrobenzyl esterase